MPTPSAPRDAGQTATLKINRTPGSVPRPDPRVTPLPVRPEPQFPCVPGYEILSVIGYGGMGVVYEARHRELNRRAAIKMLRGEALADPEYRERFRVEAEAIARLQHPNVIQVFEVGTVDAQAGELVPSPYLALEFVDGGSLTQRAYTPNPPREAAKTVETLARAAHAAHQLGVVHRDLKPANVLLTRDGTPKIADFGIAKRIDAELDAAARGLTRDGVVMGTPEYMAPEQLHGQTAAPSIDIYALGVILYELLTGRVPFQGATFADTMMLATYQEPVPPRRLQPAVPRDLETICLKCLEKDPERRYATAADLADDLARFARGETIRACPLGPVERAHRWARRNPAVAALSLLVLLVALTGVSGIVWKWTEAQANADQARASEVTAQMNAARAEGAADQAIRNADKERYERYRMSVFAASSALRLHDSVSARQALNAAPPIHRDWVWHQLHAQLDRSNEVIDTAAPIECVAFTPDGGRVMLAGHFRDHVRIWDLKTRTEFRPPEPLPNGHHTDLSPDGATALHMPDPKEVRLYTVHPWRLRAVIRESDFIRTPTFSADCKRLTTVTDSGNLREWDVATGAPLRTVSVTNSPDGLRLLSPDLRYVVTARPGGAPALCDAHTGRELASLPGHTTGLRSFHFSPASNLLISAEDYPSNVIRLWEVPSGRLLATLRGHENYINSADFSFDGKALVTAGYDRTIRVWDLSRADGGEMTARWVGKGHTNWISRAIFSPDGRRVVSSSSDRTLRYWDAATGESLAVLQGHEGWALVAAYADKGRTIVSTSADGTLRKWSVTDLENDYALRGHTSFVYGLSFNPDGRRVASAAWDGTARVWDANTRSELLRLAHTGTGKHDHIVTSIAYHRSGSQLATLCRDDFVRLWDAETGKELQRWPTAADCWADSRLAFSPTEDLLAAGGRDGRTRLWNSVSRKTLEPLDPKLRVPHRDVAFNHDGTRLATCGELGDSVVRVWDVASQQPIRTLDGHTGTIYALTWNKAGTLLASGALDNTVRLWDANTLEPVGEPLKQGANVFAVAFSPDGKLLAVGCADNLIRVWNVETRQILAELSGHKSYVHALAFSPDGSRLVSGSGDHTLRVWDTLPQKERIAGVRAN